MGGMFGVVSRKDCVTDLFFGIDYHSHLGTKKGGIAVYGENGFNRAIHNISNSPFRTKFENDIKEMSGKMGIGCISDNEPQPLLINCRLCSYAIVSVGRVANMEELIQDAFDNGHTHFLEMSGGEVNQTELIAAMINQKDTYVDGIINVLRKVKGSISFMLMTKDGLYLVRDKLGRTPLNIGKGENGFCASFESHAYINLGYSLYKELGPGEVCFMTSEEVKTLVEANDKMKICSFLWVYYGYPTSCYEGRNVEEMRYECGRLMAQRDDIKDIDLVAGVPDSGIAHAIGYSNESHIQYGRPFIKYTPTWPRSFMPQIQADRNLIAKMKLIPIASLIKGKSLLLIDDSIVRGTQLRDTTEYLYNSGARAVHIRPACPPIMYGCPYLNFSRSTSDMDLITRRVIRKREGENDINMLETYSDPDTPEYNAMVEEINELIDIANDIIKDRTRYQDVCRHKILATLFFEPSTRTRLSFESAMLSLGGNVLGFSSASNTSASKGESVSDTISVVSSYCDIIAMRHPKEGAPLVATRKSTVPLINAGDGGHNHPTQTLTDLLTIYREKGRLDNLTIGFCGDLKFGRTVHSLTKAMSRYKNIKFVFIAPPELKIPEYLKHDLLDAKNLDYKEVETIEEVIEDLDILYMTRVQKERFFNEQDYIRLKDTYILDLKKLEKSKSDLIVMHPLPRVNEIAIEVDDDPRAKYFDQVQNGRFMRMALILKMLGLENEVER